MAASVFRAARGYLVILGAIVTAIALASVLILPRGETTARWTARVPAAVYTDLPASVTVEPPSRSWFAWSLFDVAKNIHIGSINAGTETNNTESMIKAWIGADYVAGVEAARRTLSADNRELLERMIKYSDDQAAETLYQSRGADEVIERLIHDCGLTQTHVTSGLWSYTRMTANDAVTMMACVQQRAASSPLTLWLLDQMRHVAPSNAFGIAEALPPGTPVAVKNGWTLHSADGLWYVNCLASWGPWILAVLTRYPAGLGQEYGAAICQDVTRQLRDQGLG